MITTKSEAYKHFGGVSKLARILGISRQALFRWPETLTARQRHEVNGAAMELELLEEPDPDYDKLLDRLREA